jgi:hypothetical protein
MRLIADPMGFGEARVFDETAQALNQGRGRLAFGALGREAHSHASRAQRQQQVVARAGLKQSQAE